MGPPVLTRQQYEEVRDALANHSNAGRLRAPVQRKPEYDFEAARMNAMEFRRIDDARNMRRYHRLDIERDLSRQHSRRNGLPTQDVLERS